MGVRAKRGDTVVVAVTAPQALQPHRAAAYGLGLYTLLVVDSEESRPVLYKQVSGESSFTIPAPKRDDGCVIYLLNNRWIGMDEEIRYGHAALPSSASEPARPSVSKKPRRKEIREEKGNQDEVDLLSFISWEDGVQQQEVGHGEKCAVDQREKCAVDHEKQREVDHGKRREADNEKRATNTPQQITPVTPQYENTLSQKNTSSHLQPIIPTYPYNTTPSHSQHTMPQHAISKIPPTPQTQPNINVDAFLNTLFQ